MLSPSIESLVRMAYHQVGIQKMALRYYPLAVDSFERTDEDGEPLEEVGSTEFWTQAAECFESDFGPNPDPPESVNGEVSITMALSESPPLSNGAEVELEENTADDEWRREGALKLVAYRGGTQEGHESNSVPPLQDCGARRLSCRTKPCWCAQEGSSSQLVQLSYGRCFVPQQHVWQLPVTLDPQLLWTATTADAPRRTMLRRETLLAHAKFAAALQHTYPEDGRSVEEWLQLYLYSIAVIPVWRPCLPSRRAPTLPRALFLL